CRTARLLDEVQRSRFPVHEIAELQARSPSPDVDQLLVEEPERLIGLGSSKVVLTFIVSLVPSRKRVLRRSQRRNGIICFFDELPLGFPPNSRRKNEWVTVKGYLGSEAPIHR